MILDQVDKKIKIQYKNFDIQLVNLLVKGFDEIENNKNLTSFKGKESIDEIMKRINAMN